MFGAFAPSSKSAPTAAFPSAPSASGSNIHQATKVMLCLHPTGHDSVLAPPPKKLKTRLLFTNRPK